MTKFTRIWPFVTIAAISLVDWSPGLRAQNITLPPLRLDIVGRGHQGTATFSVDNGPPINVQLQDALIHLRSDSSPACTPTYANPCNYTLELLRLTFGPTAVGGVAISSTEFRNYQSIPLQAFLPSEGGPVASFPPSVQVDGTFYSDLGVSRSLNAIQASSIYMNIDPVNNILGVAGDISGTFGGHAFQGSFSVVADAPLENHPPVAVATSVPVVKPSTCSATVTLDGSGSSDPDNDIIDWHWLEGIYTVGGDPVVTVPRVKPGAHTFKLVVTDSFGGQSSSTVGVTVSPTVAPVFSNVATVTSNSCSSVSLTPPTVTHPCGLTTTLVNNAPSKFFAGKTVVRWTATDSLGNTAFVDQDVIVYLDDNGSCCPSGYNIIRGTTNNDRLVGTAGPDCILGLGGQDQIFGNGGNDIISGGAGDDVISGGDGDDVISAGTGQDTVHGDNGNDFLAGNDGDDTIYGDAGNNRLEGGQGQDHLYGGSGQDTIRGGIGDDVILGGAGNDTLWGDDGNDSINGEAGTDTCSGGLGSNTLLSCEVIQ